jgi:hypothetical protein
MLIRKVSIPASLLFSICCWADGLDRDALLTEAPATPKAGTVRVTGGGGGATQSDDPGTGSGGLNASILWAPINHLAADVGGYVQDGSVGPSARARYQFLNQADHGVDMAVGARFKLVGFSSRAEDLTPKHEAELLLAAGHKFGRLDTIVNAVVGTELGDPGKDAELKAYVGYNLSDSLRCGVDGRVQAEFADEHGTKRPRAADTAFTVGPAASWMVTPKVQVQALVGATKARGVGTQTGLGGQVAASFDF